METFICAQQQQQTRERVHNARKIVSVVLWSPLKADNPLGLVYGENLAAALSRTDSVKRFLCAAKINTTSP